MAAPGYWQADRNPFDIGVSSDPCFGERQRNEDPDGIKRNQAFCLPIKDQEQNDGTNRQGQNPIRIAQTILFFHIHVWHVFIFSHVKGQHWKG